jgi:UDP-N-acetylmuramoyl-tripeptide--D-alanyl-D-alanine ligase
VEPRSIQFIADACGGELISGSAQMLAKGFSTDSRAVQPDDVFLALVGDKFDAHTFLSGVIQQGAACIVAQRDRLPSDLTGPAVIAVKDTRRALGQIASTYRSDFDLPVIAVGGSNGKTSTKELIASVLRQKHSTLASEASFNNDIGVPVTLLKLAKSHRAAILEVGTNHPGEMAALLQMIRPRFGVVTSIGREHLEFFGDISGVVKEEGTLAEFLPVNGTLFVDGDSEWSKPITKRTRAKVVRIGWNGKNDFRARNFRMDEAGSSFVLDCAQKSLCGEYKTRFFGRHQVLNALFAIAIGAELGLSSAEIQRGLIDARPAKWRMEYWSFNGIGVLDDCYNANADSMLAALDALHDFPCKGRRVAVLGDMAELGVYTAQAHREVGAHAAAAGVDRLYTVGEFAEETARAARTAGLSSVETVNTVETLGPTVAGFLKAGDVVLIKASRAMRLERVSEYLRKSERCKE